MAKENAYVGRYGDTLRRLTALDRQNTMGAPQQVGGGDVGGFGGQLAVQPAQPSEMSGFSQQAPDLEAVVAREQAAPQVAPQAGQAAPAGGFGGAAQTPEVLQDTPGIAGPIKTGGDKPTSWGDLIAGASEEEQDQLADEVEKQGKGKMDGMLQRVRKVLGTEDVPKMSRRETAAYLAEIALRAMAKRNDPAYAQNPGGVFADAVLEASAGRQAAEEKRRLEARSDSETRRKEGREDSIHARTRKEQAEDYARERADKVSDDERNHKQALELARVQAQLLREKNKRTSIQVQEDGTLALVDEDGNAVDVTKEVEETVPTRGSRGQGTTGGGTRKVRRPVKVKPKSDSTGLDQDTILNKIAAATKALREDGRLNRELRAKFGNDPAKVDAEIQRMAREQVQGDVQSLDQPASGGKVIDFNDL